MIHVITEHIYEAVIMKELVSFISLLAGVPIDPPSTEIPPRTDI